MHFTYLQTRKGLPLDAVLDKSVEGHYIVHQTIERTRDSFQMHAAAQQNEKDAQTVPSPVPGQVVLASPCATDGADVHALIAKCAPLDRNSMYANLLQCSHFQATCVTARRDGVLIGWVSGYLLPDDPNSYFLWQVAVDESARGEGLPKRMIVEVLSRTACADVRQLKTSITRNNQASWGLFSSVARHLKADMRDEVMFEKDKHFDGHHDTEHLVTIGPFDIKEV